MRKANSIPNYRVRGATVTEINGIKFKSRLEASCYKVLSDAGFQEVKYEPERYILMNSFRLNKVSYLRPKTLSPGKYSSDMYHQERPVMLITYTPDFLISVPIGEATHHFFFDVKGKENDTYPIKKKIFLKYLESISSDINIYHFIEPHSVKQVKQAITYINSLKDGQDTREH